VKLHSPRQIVAAIAIAAGICGNSVASTATCESIIAAAARVEPRLSVNAFGGRLVGSNEGEWGGKLIFEPRAGSSIVLADDNIIDITSTPNGLIAIAGLAHLMMSRGAVYVIDADAQGVPHAEKHELPGQPVLIKHLHGDILITTRVRIAYNVPDKLQYFRIGSDRSIAPLQCE
jgi:hypothetical protein